MYVLWSDKELVIIWQTVTVYKTLNTKMVCLQKWEKGNKSKREYAIDRRLVKVEVSVRQRE